MEYKLLKPTYRLSNKKYYSIGDLIELDIEQAVLMMKDGFIDVIDQPVKTAAEKMTEFKTKTTKKATK